MQGCAARTLQAPQLNVPGMNKAASGGAWHTGELTPEAKGAGRRPDLLDLAVLNLDVSGKQDAAVQQQMEAQGLFLGRRWSPAWMTSAIGECRPRHSLLCHDTCAPPPSCASCALPPPAPRPPPHLHLPLEDGRVCGHHEAFVGKLVAHPEAAPDGCNGQRLQGQQEATISAGQVPDCNSCAHDRPRLALAAAAASQAGLPGTEAWHQAAGRWPARHCCRCPRKTQSQAGHPQRERSWRRPALRNPPALHGHAGRQAGRTTSKNCFSAFDKGSSCRIAG